MQVQYSSYIHKSQFSGKMELAKDALHTHVTNSPNTSSDSFTFWNLHC